MTSTLIISPSTMTHEYPCLALSFSDLFHRIKLLKTNFAIAGQLWIQRLNYHHHQSPMITSDAFICTDLFFRTKLSKPISFLSIIYDSYAEIITIINDPWIPLSGFITHWPFLQNDNMQTNFGFHRQLWFPHLEYHYDQSPMDTPAWVHLQQNITLKNESLQNNFVLAGHLLLEYHHYQSPVNKPVWDNIIIMPPSIQCSINTPILVWTNILTWTKPCKQISFLLVPYDL